MKESNILVGNVVNNFLRRDKWLNTKGEVMMESNILVGNVVNSQRIPVRHLPDTFQTIAKHPPDTHKIVTKDQTCTVIPSAIS